MRLFPGKAVYYISDKLESITRASVWEDASMVYDLQVTDAETWSRMGGNKIHHIQQGMPKMVAALGDGEVGVWPTPDKKYTVEIRYREHERVV